MIPFSRSMITRDPLRKSAKRGPLGKFPLSYKALIIFRMSCIIVFKSIVSGFMESCILGLRTALRHVGHVWLFSNQLSTHPLWYTWPHTRVHTSPWVHFSKQMAQSLVWTLHTFIPLHVLFLHTRPSFVLWQHLGIYLYTDFSVSTIETLFFVKDVFWELPRPRAQLSITNTSTS